MSEKKYMIYPEAEVVGELMKGIEHYLIDKDVSVLNATSALLGVVIRACLDAGINKSTVLSYFSNSWELNNPENDHPGRKNCSSVKY